MKYCGLILTKNEEHTIGTVLSDLNRIIRLERKEELTTVVSDDSSDQTAVLAEKLGAEVVKAGNRGLGHAYRVGLRKCVQQKADRILVLDGDGQASLDEIHSFIEVMDRTNADLVTGSRFLGGDSIKYLYPKLNRAGSWMLSTYLTMMTGQRFTDSHGGVRIMSARLAAAQEIFGYHTYVQESIVDACAKGFKVVEIGSVWNPRQHGESRVLNSIFKYSYRTAPYLLYRVGWLMGHKWKR